MVLAYTHAKKRQKTLKKRTTLKKKKRITLKKNTLKNNTLKNNTLKNNTLKNKKRTTLKNTLKKKYQNKRFSKKKSHRTRKNKPYRKGGSGRENGTRKRTAPVEASMQDLTLSIGALASNPTIIDQATEMRASILDFLADCHFVLSLVSTSADSSSIYLHLVDPMTKKKIYFYTTTYSLFDESLGCIIDEDAVRQAPPLRFLKKEIALAEASDDEAVKTLYIQTTMCFLNGFSLAFVMQLYIMLDVFINKHVNYCQKDDTTDAYGKIGNFNDQLGFSQPEGIYLDYGVDADLNETLEELASPDVAAFIREEAPILHEDEDEAEAEAEAEAEDEDEDEDDDMDYRPSVEEAAQFAEDVEADYESDDEDSIAADVKKGHRIASDGDCTKKAVIIYTIHHVYDGFTATLNGLKDKYAEWSANPAGMAKLKQTYNHELKRRRDPTYDVANKQNWKFNFPPDAAYVY